MASDKQYRTVFGIVQFDPKDGEAAGNDIRNIVIRNIGFREQSVNVYATLWPKHAHVAVERGDVVIVEGSYTQGKSTKKDTGEAVTYHNLSVTKIKVFGQADSGVAVEVVNDGDFDATADDDIPF